MGPIQTIEELHRLGDLECTLGLDQDDFARVRDGHLNLLQAIADPSRLVYGIDTGFGFSVKHVSRRDWKAHQRDLLRYLCVGVGEPLAERVVRRGLRLQALKTAKGISGIHPGTFERLLDQADSSALPEVPRFGSLGASGDLIPMAHAVAPIFDGYDPAGPRDVLGLVNTNAMMASYGVEQFTRTDRLVGHAVEITGLVSLALGVDDSFFLFRDFDDGDLPDGVAAAGRAVAAFRSQLLARVGREFQAVPGAPTQERYSLRCSPQVLGNVLDIQDFARRKILQEALSVADNPVVLEDAQSKPYMQHGGLFYAAGIATAADLLADCAAMTGEMLDRQILLLMDPDLSHGLPLDLSSSQDIHVKGIHQLISALLQSMRVYAAPSWSLSFSCESNNQDIVPCSMAALNALDEMLEKAQELVRACYFVALRGFALRYLNRLPSACMLENWPVFSLPSMEGAGTAAVEDLLRPVQ